MRLSPTESATLYNIGYVKKGNDNNLWIIVIDKNGVKKWKIIKKNSKILYDNEYYFLEIVNNWYDGDLKKKDDMIKSLVLSSYKWATILTPIAKELLKHGIIMFIFPMGYYFIDYAEENTLLYIKNNKNIHTFYEKFYNIKLNIDNDLEIMKMPYIYHLATVNTTLYLNHNLPNVTIKNECYDVLKKSLKNNFSWNKSEKNAIVVTIPGYKKEKIINFDKILIKKIKKDIKNIDIKIIVNGKITDNDIIPTQIKFDNILPKELEKILISYGLKKNNTKKKYKYIMEDHYIIDSEKKILYINIIDGISANIYKNIK